MNHYNGVYLQQFLFKQYCLDNFKMQIQSEEHKADTIIRRKRILAAAEKIMSKKGDNATISEIAKEAGVFDSKIYHYFKNKEDLLFSIAGDRNQQLLGELKIQLKGIRDPISKLSKMIWWQLYRHESYPEFSNLILFECRSRKNYYNHKAFDWIKALRVIFNRIFDEGIELKIFRSDLNKNALWYIVFGLTDLECIMSYSLKETGPATEDLDAIMDLLLPIILIPQVKNENRIDKTDRIFKAAERVFAQKGYEHSKIQDIARKANIADGTIYGYFTNKEDLLFSILENGFKKSNIKEGLNEHLQSIQNPPEVKSAIELIQCFIRRNLFIGLIQPDFAKLFVLNGIYTSRFYSTNAFTVFDQYMKSIFPVLDEGKADGSIRQKVNNRVFRNMIIGAFSLTNVRWHLSEHKEQIDKTKEINEMVNMLTQAIIQNPF